MGDDRIVEAARQAAARQAADERLRAAVGETGADHGEALTLREAALLLEIHPRTVAHGVARGRLRTVRVRGRRLTTRPWLRAWVEVWYPEHAGRV